METEVYHDLPSEFGKVKLELKQRLHYSGKPPEFILIICGS